MQKTSVPRPDQRATLSVEESRMITGFGRAHTYRLLREKAMPHILIGKKFYIPRTALMKWLENCGQQ